MYRAVRDPDPRSQPDDFSCGHVIAVVAVNVLHSANRGRKHIQVSPDRRRGDGDRPCGIRMLLPLLARGPQATTRSARCGQGVQCRDPALALCNQHRVKRRLGVDRAHTQPLSASSLIQLCSYFLDGSTGSFGASASGGLVCSSVRVADLFPKVEVRGQPLIVVAIDVNHWDPLGNIVLDPHARCVPHGIVVELISELAVRALVVGHMVAASETFWSGLRDRPSFRN